MIVVTKDYCFFEDNISGNFSKIKTDLYISSEISPFSDIIINLQINGEFLVYKYGTYNNRFIFKNKGEKVLR